MSYRYGLNGNDLDWDAMMFLHSFMEEVEISIHNNEAELDEDGNITDSWYEGICNSNPTYIYYGGEELNIQDLLDSGKKMGDYKDWFIVHDSNDNFVTFVGDVPDKYLTEEYIKERDEAEAEGAE